MTRDEAVSFIQMTLGFRSDKSAEIITCLKLAQIALELAPTKPWFLISEEATILTVIGEQRIPFPTDFLEELDESQVTYVPEDTGAEVVQLTKDDNDYLTEIYTGEVTGPPEAYSIDGTYFRLFPTPDDAYVLRMRYYQRGALLVTNVENEWLRFVPNLLLGGAGKLIAASLRDKSAYQQFSSMETEGRALLYSQNEARIHANRTYQIGGAH